MTKASLLVLPLLLLACACQTKAKPVVAPPMVVAEANTGWRGEANPEDAARIESIGLAWQRALQNARRAGFSRQIQREGKLLVPTAGLPYPAPSPGSYMCRVVRLGPHSRRTSGFASFNPYFCFVGAGEERLFLTKQTGTERPSGYLWDSGIPRSMVFLGSIAMGAEDESVPYGQDRTRDAAGLFERIGPLRFRLVLVRDVIEGRMDVIELVPADVQNEE